MVSDFGFMKKPVQKIEPPKLPDANENTAKSVIKDTANQKNWLKGEANKRKL